MFPSVRIYDKGRVQKRDFLKRYNGSREIYKDSQSPVSFRQHVCLQSFFWILVQREDHAFGGWR